MDILIQLIVSGLLTGGVYSLMALAIVIIYKSSGIYNFAHGALVALGGFLCWSLLVQLQLPFWLVIIILLITAFALGWLIEIAILRPMTGQPHLPIIMATLGMTEILAGIILLIWPGQNRWFPTLPFESHIRIGEIVLSTEMILSFIICIVCFLVFLVFEKTRIGLAMRAVAEDAQTSRSSGIKVRRIFRLVWIIAIAIAIISGIFLGLMHGATLAIADLALKAFPAVLLGGLESVIGALLGGTIIGVLENLGGGYIDPYVGGGIKDLIPFVILLLVLIIKPYGIFGYKRIERI